MNDCNIMDIRNKTQFSASIHLLTRNTGHATSSKIYAFKPLIHSHMAHVIINISTQFTSVNSAVFTVKLAQLRSPRRKTRRGVTNNAARCNPLTKLSSFVIVVYVIVSRTGRTPSGTLCNEKARSWSRLHTRRSIV